MKRAQSLSDALAPETKVRNVAYATYQKLKTDMNHWECLTVTWLDCDTRNCNGRKNIVTKLRCSVCAKFKTRIAPRRNISEQWLRGVESVHTSNSHDHARADQHIYANHAAVTAYIAAVGANMHTHDTVKCIYTRPVCKLSMCNKHILLSKQFGKVANQI